MSNSYSSQDQSRELLNKELALALSLANERNFSEAADRFEAVAAKSSQPMAAKLLFQAAVWLTASKPFRAIQLLEKVLLLEESHAAAWSQLGFLQDSLGNRNKSIMSAQKAFDLSTDSDLTIRAATLLMRHGRYEQALPKAYEEFKKLGSPANKLIQILYGALGAANFKLSREIIQLISNNYKLGKYAEVNETPRTHVLWCGEEKTNIEVFKNYSSRRSLAGEKNKFNLRIPVNGRKLKIGYLSSDFRDHATAWLINGLLRNHDKSNFELFAYCSSWDDKSVMRKKVLSHFSTVRSVTDLSDKEASQQIVNDGIDVLIDLNGNTKGARLGILDHRSAPVQISYLGFPGSTGCKEVDYIIGDEYVTPRYVNSYYPEKIIRIDKTYQINDYMYRKLQLPRPKIEYGLPNDKVVLGVFNAINKVGEQVWLNWMDILKSNSNAILWILDPGPVARKNLLDSARVNDISTDRIIFAPKLPQDHHISRMQVCDLMLDTYPYGGHTTTSDAIFAGIPIIALEGTNFASRVSGSLLSACGLADLIASTPADYVAKASELIRDPVGISTMKSNLKLSRFKLDIFNAASKTKQLESAYLISYGLFEKKLPFKNIDFKLDVKVVEGIGL